MAAGPARPRVRWGSTALAAVAGLAVAACSAGVRSPVGAGGPSPAASRSAATARARTRADRPSVPWPLTGLPAPSAADAARPAVALVLAGPAPSGLAAADLVFQEISTPARYISVYQSKQAGTVGPIAGTQPTDPQALSVLHALVGYDGAQTAFFVRILDKAKVTDAGYGRYPSLYRATPAGLVTSTQAVSRAAHGSAPPQLLQYRGGSPGSDALATTGVSKPGSVRIVIPGYGTEEWRFDRRASRWMLVSGGPKAEAANLVVQMVSYKQIAVNRRRGVFVPSARLVGTGRSVVFSADKGGGTSAAGTWSKPHAGDVTNYVDASGSPMEFQPGPTWVILAPAGTQVSPSGSGS
jgi:hypothetical protein